MEERHFTVAVGTIYLKVHALLFQWLVRFSWEGTEANLWVGFAVKRFSAVLEMQCWCWDVSPRSWALPCARPCEGRRHVRKGRTSTPVCPARGEDELAARLLCLDLRSCPPRNMQGMERRSGKLSRGEGLWAGFERKMWSPHVEAGWGWCGGESRLRARPQQSREVASCSVWAWLERSLVWMEQACFRRWWEERPERWTCARWQWPWTACVCTPSPGTASVALTHLMLNQGAGFRKISLTIVMHFSLMPFLSFYFSCVLPARYSTLSSPPAPALDLSSMRLKCRYLWGDGKDLPWLLPCPAAPSPPALETSQLLACGRVKSVCVSAPRPQAGGSWGHRLLHFVRVFWHLAPCRPSEYLGEWAHPVRDYVFLTL